MKFTAISLFTGAGGLDYGFEAAGYRTTVALEIDARCAKTIRHNRKSWNLIDKDIASVSTKEILRTAALRAGEPDILIGGPPCQPFSKSGFWATGDVKRLSDPRANTLECYLRVLAEARPKAFLLENVEGMGFKGKDDGLRLIQSHLEAINSKYRTKYQANIATLNAAEYGVPQQRRRIFVVGSRDGKEFRFPSKTHTEVDETSKLLPYATVWDALHDLPEPNAPETVLRGKWADLLSTIPEGENYLWHTDRGGGVPLFGWRTRYWSFLLKLAKRQPSWTIQAQPGPATGPFHWNNRRLTMREMARIQTFPDKVEVIGTLADAQRQIGNAVPSLLAEVLARSIATQLLGRSEYKRPPSLAVNRATVAPPPDRKISAVPERYLLLRGTHAAHPGTGKGRRATARPPLIAAE